MRRGTFNVVLLAAVAAAAGGCESSPMSLGLVQTPQAQVHAVELTEVSEAGAAARVIVELSNPNDVPLPLRIAQYKVALGEVSYSGDTHPNATIPAHGTQRITLPAAVSGRPGDAYKVNGTITFQPPGEIRQLMTDVGIPLPWVSINGEGPVTGDPPRIDYTPPPAPAEPNTEPADQETSQVEST